ncbi:hypothetical protein P3342_002427 [Pyrenophora teres f. teres]|nr:hypothetical protein P3342_002427 [Pyrenophora teres f. teres]
MQQYEVAAENVYNMDEKGFMMGIIARSKRVFTRAIWEQKERTAAIQDGNREWVTILACICGDGSSLPPALIYEGKAGIQSSWVSELQAEIHEVFVANSTSGWTNNELGLAWLEQIFDRFTRDKARRRWRLLILDGHGSHVTSDFINFCGANKILLAVFPPHSTHSLQPLDVVMFAPLANAYSQQLQQHIQRGQGTMGPAKAEFFNILGCLEPNFQAELILKSFQATGVLPMNAEARGDGDSWRQLRKVLDVAVVDKDKVEAKQVEQALHSLQVKNELLHHENESLHTALNTRTKRKLRSKALDLQRSDQQHSGSVFWSPYKIEEAREREVTKQQETEQLQLQKTLRELRAASLRYKKLMADEAKAERQRAKTERDEAKKARAAELSARRAAKQQQRNAATSQNSQDTHKTPRRTASRKPVEKKTRRRGVVVAESEAAAAPTAPPPPPKTTTRGRTIKLPQKFK